MYETFVIDAAVNANAAVKTPIKRTISTGDATKTQILQVTANPNSSIPDTKRIRLEASGRPAGEVAKEEPGMQ